MEPQQQAEEQQVMVPIHPTAITTPTGLIMVWGFEHVSAKMLTVLKVMLSHDAFERVYHGIKSVVFRTDGYPKQGDNNICASFAPDVCGISINLEKTLERAIDRSLDHPETSIFASWWIEMVLNFGHELHHGVRWNTDRGKLYGNEEMLEDEEKRAEEYCNEVIIELAQEYDIEMPSIEEETWFNNQIIELFSGKDDSDTWATSQKGMLTEKVVWRHESEDSEAVVIHTFKDLVCLISNGNIEAEEWSKPTILLKPDVPTLDEQLNGKKITRNAAGEQGEVVQPTPAAINPANSDFASGVFVNEDEDYSDIYEEGEYYDDQEDIPQAAQPVVQPVAAAQPSANAAPFSYQPPATDEPQYDIATINRIAKGVYMKMYNFIFRNCGPLKDSDVGFSNPEAVLTTPLLLTPEETALFVTMDHMDVNGRWCQGVSTKKGLFGKVMKNTKLPAYEVVLNINGTIHRRLFIPQNPNKYKNGVLTQRALEARGGNAIAYIKNQSTDEWGPYIINGEYKLPQGK